MKVGIISDIHSNLEALEVSLAWLDEQKVDEIICLGDVVGYGPDPNACCDLVSSHASVTLLGNHDAAVIGAMSTEYYYDAARVAIKWTRRRLSSEHLEWLFKLPYSHHRSDWSMGFYHAAPISPSGYFYVVFKEDAQAHLRMFDRLSELSLLGHSHLVRSFRLMNGKAKEVQLNKVHSEPNAKFIASVGSVGQPRDRDPLGAVSYVDTETKEITLHRFDYDRKKTARKIAEAGLESRFGERLFTGS